MNTWLAVEREENWQADSRNNYRTFGLPQRKKKLAEQVKAGDRVIFYVSRPVSSIVNMRIVTEDGIHDAKQHDYDEPFMFEIRTSPLTILSVSNWIPFGALGMPKGRLQNCFRKLDEVEARILTLLIDYASS